MMNADDRQDPLLRLSRAEERERSRRWVMKRRRMRGATMANESLVRLSDRQLTQLFAAARILPLSERSKQVLSEMERRGYIYDDRRRDFITCEEWNKRHGHLAAMDCEKQARVRSDREWADGRKE